MRLWPVAGVVCIAIIVTAAAAVVIGWAPPGPPGAESVPRKACNAPETEVVFPVAQYVAPSGVLGTSTDDLQGFASGYNQVRIANCLTTIATANFRHSACIEQRLIWMAEDPSEDPLSAWGHNGTERSDGVPPRGCDANLAGGPGTTGARASLKWWSSVPHRESLYRPDYGGPLDNVCLDFAMAHGGVPNESLSFTRAGAAWVDCTLYPDQVERQHG